MCLKDSKIPEHDDMIGDNYNLLHDRNDTDNPIHIKNTIIVNRSYFLKHIEEIVAKARELGE